MAARTRKIKHDDETRAKIQAGVIIDRMTKCVLGELTLDAQQVSCGKALLNKVLPDLQAVSHEGEVTISPIQALLDAIDGRSRAIPSA
jgi:hypothetical protein